MFEWQTTLLYDHVFNILLCLAHSFVCRVVNANSTKRKFTVWQCKAFLHIFDVLNVLLGHDALIRSILAGLGLESEGISYCRNVFVQCLECRKLFRALCNFRDSRLPICFHAFKLNGSYFEHLSKHSQNSTRCPSMLSKAASSPVISKHVLQFSDIQAGLESFGYPLCCMPAYQSLPNLVRTTSSSICVGALLLDLLSYANSTQ